MAGVSYAALSSAPSSFCQLGCNQWSAVRRGNDVIPLDFMVDRFFVKLFILVFVSVFHLVDRQFPIRYTRNDLSVK